MYDVSMWDCGVTKGVLIYIYNLMSCLNMIKRRYGAKIIQNGASNLSEWRLLALELEIHLVSIERQRSSLILWLTCILCVGWKPHIYLPISVLISNIEWLFKLENLIIVLLGQKDKVNYKLYGLLWVIWKKIEYFDLFNFGSSGKLQSESSS